MQHTNTGTHPLYLILLLLGLLIGCTPQENKEPAELLEVITQLMEAKHYDQAIVLIDSLNKSYPKALEERKAALDFLKRARMLKSTRDSAYLSPTVAALQVQEAELLQRDFRRQPSSELPDYALLRYKGYEPSSTTDYLDVYFAPDDDEFTIVVATTLKYALEGHSVTLTETESDTYVLTSEVPYDGGRNYRFTDEGKHYERLTFVGEEAMQLATFVASPITEAAEAIFKVTIHGSKGREHSFTLSREAIKAITACYHLQYMRDQIAKAQQELDLHERRRTKAQSAR